MNIMNSIRAARADAERRNNDAQRSKNLLDIAAEVRAIVNDQIGGAPVAQDDRLEDIGASDVEIVMISMALESRYGITLSEDEMSTWVFIGDIVNTIERLV